MDIKNFSWAFSPINTLDASPSPGPSPLGGRQWVRQVSWWWLRDLILGGKYVENALLEVFAPSVLKRKGGDTVSVSSGCHNKILGAGVLKQ